MKFILMIHGHEGRPAEEDRKLVERHMRYGAELTAAGKMLGGQRLRPAAEAVCVTNHHGKHSVVDGPFAETKEVLGGFYLIECASKAEAIEWAAKCPGADYGTVEVRPIWEM